MKIVLISVKSLRKNFKRVLMFLLVIIMLVVCSDILFSLHKSALEKKQNYQNKITFYTAVSKAEHEWIYQNNVSNGAILFYKKNTGTTSVVPYFSNIAATGLLKQPFDQNDKDVVLRYLDWYFTHLNCEEHDVTNGSGTIYNYNIVLKNDIIVSEESLNKYDSVDSYAASFLILLNAYYEKTEDTEYIINHIDKTFIVIDALRNTIDSDGLSRISKTKDIKYLMDNVEVNKGLKDILELLEKLSEKDEYHDSPYYNQGKLLLEVLNNDLSNNTNAIEKWLWNQDECRYEIGLYNNKIIAFEGWDSFYADAIAQIFPIALEVIEPDSERARQLYSRFCEEYSWEKMEHYLQEDSSFYWCVLAYVGALMGDEKRVDEYLSYYSSHIAVNHDYPLYVAESGWCIMACDKMIELNQKKIQEIGFFSITNLFQQTNRLK